LRGVRGRVGAACGWGCVGMCDGGGCSAWQFRCPAGGHTRVRRVGGGPRSSRDEPVYRCLSCGETYGFVVDVVRDAKRYAARKPD